MPIHILVAEISLVKKNDRIIIPAILPSTSCNGLIFILSKVHGSVNSKSKSQVTVFKISCIP